MVVNLNIPFYYTDKELYNILNSNNIDLNINIKECKEYMNKNGWSLSKRKQYSSKEVLVLNSGVIKKILDFNGWKIEINRRNEFISSIMENEKDAMIVCILETIKRE
jgi:hypothetical protein